MLSDRTWKGRGGAIGGNDAGLNRSILPTVRTRKYGLAAIGGRGLDRCRNRQSGEAPRSRGLESVVYQKLITQMEMGKNLLYIRSCALRIFSIEGQFVLSF